jgi:hypothetical protein
VLTTPKKLALAAFGLALLVPQPAYASDFSGLYYFFLGIYLAVSIAVFVGSSALSLLIKSRRYRYLAISFLFAILFAPAFIGDSYFPFLGTVILMSMGATDNIAPVFVSGLVSSGIIGSAMYLLLNWRWPVVPKLDLP